MKEELFIKISQKAKTKNDGVYSFMRYQYLVKKNKFVAFCDSFGNVYQRMGYFNVKIGELEKNSYLSERKKKLLSLLNTI